MPQPISFSSDRKNLVKMLENEVSFKLQVYSLESIYIFEQFLTINEITYQKGFTSSQKHSKTIVLLLDDGPMNINNNRVILYSNTRNYDFIPYKFKLTLAEKQLFIEDKVLLGSTKDSSVTSVIHKTPDIHKYTALCLNYFQSVIVMCMIKESNIKKLCDEVKTVDPSLNNTFSIKLELNWLCLHNYCKKNGNTYKLMISNEAVQNICSKLGFKHFLKNN